MKIASFTMVGQYPHGIDLHIRNLKWALGDNDKIYIVTTPEIIDQFNLRDDEKVNYIHFKHECEGTFIKFWDNFPAILKKLDIHPNWFLFMESDIWFHQKVEIQKDKSEIASYLPLQKEYHAIMIDGKVSHPRVWEGGMLIHSDVVRNAINFGISFAYPKPFFYEEDKEEWEKKAGGKIQLKYFGQADTFDEFGLYCALVEKTNMKYYDKCIHLRGPESLHRKYPDLYFGCTDADLIVPQKKLPYLCVYAALAPYFIDGHWTGDIKWQKIQNKQEFLKLKNTAYHWMMPEEYSRLNSVIENF